MSSMVNYNHKTYQCVCYMLKKGRSGLILSFSFMLKKGCSGLILSFSFYSSQYG